MGCFHDTSYISLEIECRRIDRVIVGAHLEVDRPCDKVIHTIGNIELGLGGSIAIYLIEHTVYLVFFVQVGLLYYICCLDRMFVGEVLGILEQFGKVVLHWLIGDIYGGFHLGIVQIHTAPFLKIKGGKMVLLKRKRTRLFYSVISRFRVLQAKKGFWLGLYIA